MAKFLFTMLVVNDLGLPTRASARRVAESMRKFGGAREAAERIERFAGGHA